MPVMVGVGLALAAVIGLVVGMLGAGGGILTVPLVHYVLGIEAHAAVATSLAVVAVTSLAALVPYAQRGHVRWRLGVQLGVASMCGAYLTARLARLVPPSVLLLAFALVLVGAAIAMLRPERDVAERTLPPHLAIVVGVMIGGVAGFIGAGGGFLIVPVLLSLGSVALPDAIGTSLLVIVMNSTAGFAGAHDGVELDGTLVALLAGVSIAGSIAGALYARRVAPRRLRQGFGVLLAVIAAIVLALEAPAAFG